MHRWKRPPGANDSLVDILNGNAGIRTSERRRKYRTRGQHHFSSTRSTSPPLLIHSFSSTLLSILSHMGLNATPTGRCAGARRRPTSASAIPPARPPSARTAGAGSGWSAPPAPGATRCPRGGSACPGTTAISAGSTASWPPPQSRAVRRPQPWGPGRRRRARGQLAAGRCWGSAPAAVLEIIEFGTTGQVAGFIAKAIQVRFIYTNGVAVLACSPLSLVQH